MRKILLIILAVSFMIGNVYAERVDISGNVYHESQPLCVIVLANGQHMFTNSADGRYDLTVPLSDNGEITLFSFCDGMAPFKQILQPEQAINFDIYMSPSYSAKNMNLTAILAPANEDGWVEISGKAATDGGKPLCIMVLVNGQHMFTSAEDGLFKLTVPLDPLDEEGKVTLYGFCDGFAPFRRILRVMI